MIAINGTGTINHPQTLGFYTVRVDILLYCIGFSACPLAATTQETPLFDARTVLWQVGIAMIQLGPLVEATQLEASYML